MTTREWEPMTMNEMKESLAIMEETAAADAPRVDPHLVDKINEMRERIVEWEKQILPW